jgi:hypothetical protein
VVDQDALLYECLRSVLLRQRLSALLHPIG